MCAFYEVGEFVDHDVFDALDGLLSELQIEEHGFSRGVAGAPFGLH